MKTVDTNLEDELRAEYDLRSLSVRKIGTGRTRFGDVVRLEPDIAKLFSDAGAVNEALRSLIKIAKKSTTLTRRST